MVVERLLASNLTVFQEVEGCAHTVGGTIGEARGARGKSHGLLLLGLKHAKVESQTPEHALRFLSG